jgi:hypothetical protein
MFRADKSTKLSKKVVYSPELPELVSGAQAPVDSLMYEIVDIISRVC